MNIDEAKLFVGGISRETSEETLRNYFSKYGVVSHSLIAKDKITKFPRGFGFVVFSDPPSAARALQDNHVILGRTVEVKKALPKIEKHQHHYQHQQQRQHHPHGSIQEASNGLGMNSDNSTSAKNNRTKKIFVGGLASSLTEEQFKNYFEQFGRTVDVVVMQDSLTNRPRGFGFVTFDSEESVDKVLLIGSHELNGKRVEVKKAVPKDRINGHIVRSGSNGFIGNGPQLGNHPFYGQGYDPCYTSFPVYNDVHGHFYGMSFYGSVYPMVGYGRPGLEVAPMAPMLGAGLFPYSNACLYPAYAHNMSSISGMEIGGHNQIVEAGLNGEESGSWQQWTRSI